MSGLEAAGATVTAERPALLVTFELEPELLDVLRERFFVVHAPGDEERAAGIDRYGPFIELVLTTGTHGLNEADMQEMPRLTLIAAFGAGYEAIDLAAAAQRGIAVCNGPGINDDCVADHALALLLAAVRGIGPMDAAVRRGLWRDDLQPHGQLARSRVGLLGMGRIGRKIARRLDAFDVEVGYHARHRADELAYRYFDSLPALASWADHLVIAAPGGAQTHHMVDGEVLAAMRPHGWLVNVGRGSIVDTAALADALGAGRLGGAALDVYEGEPSPPAGLMHFDNVLLTPHAAGSSPQAMRAGIDLFLENARLHLLGQTLLSPLRPASQVPAVSP